MYTRILRSPVIALKSSAATAVANHLRMLKTTLVSSQPSIEKLLPAQASHFPTPDEQTTRQQESIHSTEQCIGQMTGYASNMRALATTDLIDSLFIRSYAHWQEFAAAAAYLFCSRWLYCYQTQILLQQAAKQISSGSTPARVELIVRLFSSIVDVVNFHQVCVGLDRWME